LASTAGAAPVNLGWYFHMLAHLVVMVDVGSESF
jgi:hypothetical protein